MPRFLTLLLLVQIGISAAQAQQTGIVHVNDPLHDFIERVKTQGHLHGVFTQHRPLSRAEARMYLDSLDAEALAPIDRTLLSYYRGDTPMPGAVWAQSFWGTAFANGSNLLSVYGDDYAFEADPLLYLTAGRSIHSTGGNRPRTTYQNTRGVRASGQIGLIFFETRLEENQRRDAWPAFNRKTAPRLGGTKFYPESQEYDYWRAMGLVGIRTKNFEIRAGRDRNRWGSALGSLFLSEYAPEYDQIQIRTSVWRLQYVNLFTAWTDFESIDRYSDQVLPRKYGALHSLTIDLPARVQLQLYESVISAPDYRDGRRQGFDLSYLNPVIFYRAVEIDRGSPDNMQLGAGISWIPIGGLRLYAQALLTEFKLDELLSGDGWFGNKWGWTTGFHVAPAHIPGLDVQFEHTRIRPFTYSHWNVQTTFVHYDDPLGHPAGQNVFDYALSVSYRPHPRWAGTLNTFYTRGGRNPSEENWGADPRLSYQTRVRNHGHFIGQGVRVDEYRFEAHAGYELLPRMHIELAIRLEHRNDAEFGTDRYVNPMLQLRWGLPFQSLRY